MTHTICKQVSFSRHLFKLLIFLLGDLRIDLHTIEAQCVGVQQHLKAAVPHFSADGDVLKWWSAEAENHSKLILGIHVRNASCSD